VVITYKVLRTGKGGEYISREFQFFCNVHDVYNKFTVWYTPQWCHREEKLNHHGNGTQYVGIQKFVRSVLG
jgi:hypothetical protein